MSGAKSLLPIYAFTAWTGNTFLTLSSNYSFSSVYYTSPTGAKLKSNELGGIGYRRSGPNWIWYPNICLERLQKTAEDLRIDCIYTAF